jgi:raffinose/stachyose/melibiose transport system substrate-binding protein
MKRFIIFVSLSLLVLGGAWANGTAEGSAAGKPAHLSVSYKSGDATRKVLFASIFDNFNKKNKGQYEIEPLETGSQTHEELLKVRLATGDFPEIWEVVELNNYIRAGVAGELPAEVGSLMKYLPLLNGKSYFAPIEDGVQGVFYNKDLFAKNGIAAPTTYAEFLAACDTIKATGVTPLAFGGKDSWHTHFLITCLLQTTVLNKNPIFISDLNAGKAKWTDKDPLLALQKYQDLFTKGYIDKNGALSTADAQLPTMMAAGQDAMLVEGPWMIKPIMDADASYNLGFFPLPADKAADTVIPVQGLGSGWGMSKKAVDDPRLRAAGIAFLKYFFSPEVYVNDLKTTGAFSTIKAAVTVQRPPAGADIEKALATGKSANFYAGGIGDGELPAGWWEYSWKVCQDLAVGVVSPSEAGSQLQQYYEKMLAAHK